MTAWSYRFYLDLIDLGELGGIRTLRLSKSKRTRCFRRENTGFFHFIWVSVRECSMGFHSTLRNRAVIEMGSQVIMKSGKVEA